MFILNFQFHNTVPQHSSGEVEFSMTGIQRVSLRIRQWSNFENWSTFADVL